MNKFVITGIPRSGTTVFARTLSKIDNIHVANDQHDFYEPFKIMSNSLDLNPLPRLKELEDNCRSNYFGFKSFPGDLLDLTALRLNGYKTFAIVRKDIWKSIFSHAIARTKLFRDNDNTAFKGSSKLYTESVVASSISELPPPLLRMFQDSFFTRIKHAYEFETQYKNTDVIYFEDLIKPNASFKCVNTYFNKEIIFNLNYDDSDDFSSYYKNFSPELLHNMCRHFIQTVNIPNDCPQYIKDSIYKYYIGDS